MRVAALLDESGHAVAPQAGGTIHVFELQDRVWADIRTLAFPPPPNASMEQLRQRVGEVCSWLADCQVLAAGATNGYYRVTFASFGVALWPVLGTPEQFIDQVADFYLHAANRQCEPEPDEPAQAAIQPVPERTGHYRVDLRGTMGKPGAHASQAVLLPFLQEASFQRLEIWCDHVPRWFSHTLPELGLASKEENSADFVRVQVYPLKDRNKPRIDFPVLDSQISLC